MKPTSLLLASIALLGASMLGACMSLGPVGTPDEVATQLVTHLEAGETDAADELFDRVEDDADYRRQIYPIVFAAAREHYTAGESATAVEMLRFMARGYPDALAVREALLYSLFLERANRGAPDEELTKAIGESLNVLRERSSDPPVWLDLVAAQHAIDKGELVAAREFLSAFVDAWDGRPQELLIYVEDIERYLRSH